MSNESSEGNTIYVKVVESTSLYISTDGRMFVATTREGCGNFTSPVSPDKKGRKYLRDMFGDTFKRGVEMSKKEKENG